MELNINYLWKSGEVTIDSLLSILAKHVESYLFCIKVWRDLVGGLGPMDIQTETKKSKLRASAPEFVSKLRASAPVFVPKSFAPKPTQPSQPVYNPGRGTTHFFCL